MSSISRVFPPIVLSLALAFASLACSKSDTPATSDFVPETDAGPSCMRGSGASVTKTIGVAGGTISLETLTVEVPPNAILRDTLITLTSTTACPALGDDFVAASPIYEIDPAGIVDPQADVTVRYVGPDRGSYLFVADENGELVVQGGSNSGNAALGKLHSFTSVVAGTFAARTPLSLRVVPSTIDFDGTANLVVEVPPSTSCSLDPAPLGVTLERRQRADGTYFLAGTTPVRPTSPTTYTATCTSASGTTTLTAKVDLAAVVDFQVRPTSVLAGQTVTINWTGRPQIASCELVEATENVHTKSLPATNTVTRAPSATTTYTLLCLDAGDRLIARKQVTVQVVPPGSDAGVSDASDAG